MGEGLSYIRILLIKLFSKSFKGKGVRILIKLLLKVWGKRSFPRGLEGQITIDFMLSIIIALIFFVIVLNSAYSQLQDVRDIFVKLDAIHVSKKLAGGINDVYLLDHFSQRNIALPITLYGGINYTITVYPRLITLTYNTDNANEYSHRLLTKDINGSLNGLTINPGTVLISNENETIYLKNI